MSIHVKVLLLFFVIITAILTVALFKHYYLTYVQNEEVIDILVKKCSERVKDLDGSTLWRTNNVLVYNKSIFAKGFIREKVVYRGKYYNIVVDNGTHLVVYTASVGRFPMYSKGVFYEIHAVVIYRKDSDLKPAIIYSYRYAKNSYPHCKYYYFYPIRNEDRMLFHIARYPFRPIHSWIRDFVRRDTMNVSIDHKKVLEVKLLKDYKINGRSIWIVRYSFLNESVDVYACIDVETGIVLAEIFVGKDQTSIGYLENITDIDNVPANLLSMIRNAVFVDITTNKTLRIPKP